MTVPPAEPDPAAPPQGPAQPSPLPRRSLRVNTLIVMAGTLGSRLSGIVRQQIINLFDTSLTDAFNVAVKVPNLLRELLAEGALVNSFIPVYKSLDAAERRKLAATFSGVLIAVNLILMALGILAAPWIVGLLTAADSNIDRAVAVYMTQLVMPFLTLISLSAVAMGLLNADEHFRESSFAPVAFNLASIVALLLLPDTATWLAFGWLIGGVAQLLVQLPALRRYGLLPTPALTPHPAVRRVLVQMAPFTLTAGARQILNVYVTRLLTNGAQFPTGTTTGYGNAEALFTTVNGLFVVSPVLAMFPRFSQHAADRDWAAFRALTAQAIRTTTFLAAPMSALLVVLAPWAVSLFNLQRGLGVTTKFEAGAGILTGWALALVPWALVTVLLRTFYARERTREAVVVSALGFVLEVGLYRLLVPPLGFLGFGVSTALSGLLMSGALIVLYRRALGFPGREVATHLLRVVPLSVLAGGVAWLVSRLMPAPGFIVPGVIGLSVAGGAGLAAYLAGALALRVPEVSGVLRRLRR
ncbi:murein biosynthesis integral membrane protein MurJ [Deinococcus koreensis]|uniref:Murein biosynthesis integral membrane protein MurJ n=1 Tax=Deinococcus koreensis TaxID=2054903 RepID=A0A2K3UVY0_9DEIO|nr:murein biosynthesis integral membrane protein MurJ [Deinococcus koreensis]PNY80670.1 murein biosynthesis integral membrane protein MurJ [Deinococcus koreensis]